MTQQALRHEQADSELLLIVDDDDGLRAAVVDALEMKGFRVVERACGREALDYLERGERPDLIILDLVMPGMDGWEFRVEQLRKEPLASIPVIALSADASPKARALNAAAFIAKPTTAQILLQTVERVLIQSKRSQRKHEQHAAEELSYLAKWVDEAVRPVRLANNIHALSLDAALAHLASGELSRSALEAWLTPARKVTRAVDRLLLRAELFAHRNFAAAAAAQARVLLVDDRAPRREQLVTRLRDLFSVDAVRSANDALAQLAAGGDYDVVICRLAMREMSGAELLIRLAESHPEQAKRMLFIAGNSAQEEAEEARIADRQYLGVLRGPVMLEELRAVVESTLEERH